VVSSRSGPFDRILGPLFVKPGLIARVPPPPQKLRFVRGRASWMSAHAYHRLDSCLAGTDRGPLPFPILRCSKTSIVEQAGAASEINSFSRWQG
jgi:hypothetical protein